MIDENVLERLKPYLTEVSYPKGYVLFNSEKLERNIYFIKRGMARAVSYTHLTLPTKRIV